MNRLAISALAGAVAVALGGCVARVSVTTAGYQATGGSGSESPSISADGRFVAFASTTTDLVPEDANGASDVFVHDRVTATTERVSLTPAGTQIEGVSRLPAIDGDGDRIAFETTGALVAGDINPFTDVYLRDRTAEATTLMSSFANGFTGMFVSREPAISGDGLTVAFASFVAYDPADANVFADVYLRTVDQPASAPLLVTAAPGGSDSNSFRPVLDATGAVLAFTSAANNLIPGDSGRFDVFAYETGSAILTRLSVGTGGVETNNGSNDAAVSPDGRFVTFTSFATNVVVGDTNAAADVFRADRVRNAVIRLSFDNIAGVENNGDSRGRSAVATDGRATAYATFATNLGYETSGAPDVDTNSAPDVVVWALPF